MLPCHSKTKTRRVAFKVRNSCIMVAKSLLFGSHQTFLISSPCPTSRSLPPVPTRDQRMGRGNLAQISECAESGHFVETVIRRCRSFSRHRWSGGAFMRCNSSCMPCGYLGTTIRWAEETYRRIVTYRGVGQRIDVSRPMRETPCFKANLLL